MGQLKGRWLWLALGLLVVLSPLGLLAEGAAWGEWAPEELEGMLGFVPAGSHSLSGIWQAPLPDYGLGGLPPSVGYVLSAIVGVGCVLGVTWLLGRWLSYGPSDG